ncbi:uncharacterized protein HRG_11892 [Hirsutella rhossiliensis]|uniref:Uncharacterized protein n=1 Tax=Hirsutella rhossiliensis TaxID=111463 RepID=A0A9P8ML65_9HYPO|nr:uncharacterized protein HRG_11892 [Hirsutella rhossiliensis]KAH0957024.1 hypothetical protein HRG_11892 [Hirsutella rhossiliensis]
MSMMFFAQPDCPARFAHHDEHRIRGLNAEAIARVLLPVPSWLLEADYAPLRAEGDDLGPSLFFSLNLSIYGQPIVDTDWSEQWFFMSGRVHPYALAWEVERRDGLEAGPDDTVLYSARPYPSSHALASGGQFPSTPPVVSFHGVIAGPGLDLLRGDFLPERDYVFIVVPDSWNFVDRPSAAASASASPLATPLKRQTLSASSTFDSVRAALYSVAAPASAASAPPSLASAPTALDPVTPPPKRSHPALADTPMKRARLLQQQNSPPSSSSDTVSSAALLLSPPAASSSRPSGVPPVPLRQPSRVPS